MFPLKDSVPSRSFPIVNYILIIFNLGVFFKEFELAQHGLLESFIFTYGLIPGQFMGDPLSHLSNVFTSMFMHGSWGHVIGNIWFLYIFGDNVEDNIGHLKYLFYYLLMGVGAALAQVWSNPDSAIPMVGASGAIAGILGSYIVLYPKARVMTLFFIFIFIRIVEVPAYLFLGYWFIVQAVNGMGSLTQGHLRGEMGGVAWWAHAGGFLSGFLAIHFFRKRKRG